MRAMAQVTELRGHVLGGKYRLVRAVSEGPRRVYEARHARLAGRFAVERWPATTPWDAFRHGAELAVTLRHPGIVQVIDFNCEPGASPFLVLEWIDGARLSEVIAEAGIMPIERVAPLVESAAWALASAHGQGIVHEQLCPDEVFVVHAPGTMREWVKLAGFGVDAALARAGTTAPSRYRAPEQKGASPRALDDEADGADPQSDQYALAAIAYEMLAGVPPFDKEASRAEPLPISDVAPGVTPAVDAAIRQALAAEPEQRFAGVLEFARALRDAVDGASPEALRRRAAASVPPERRARAAEPVSPFFNPLQGRAGEVIRRVVSSTARLRTLGSRLGPPLPDVARLRGPAARIALAGAMLVLAVTVTALALRKRGPAAARPAVVAAAAHAPPAPAHPAAPAAPVVPAPAPPTAPATPEPAAPAAAEPQRTAATLPVVATAGDGAEPPTDAADATGAQRGRASAWARLGGGGERTSAKPARKTHGKVAAGSPSKSPAPKAVKVAAASAPGASGPCVMSVGSRPPADIWLDDHSLGRRTPLVRYHTACGDHKLALKRTDLDLYQMEIVTLRAGSPFKKVYPLQ
jgi:serine/threonine-protein kinase